jgi:mono/diheme cytochrome c family protein
LQRLGTGLGDWRETFAPTRLSNGAAVHLSVSEKQRALLPLGKQVYERRCIGCHGASGDGNGPSARFLNPKPRDFTSGIFKFRSTLGGRNTLPTDEDLYITITHGLWGTDMPPWYMIPHNERLAVIQYIKEFSQRWQTEQPGQPVAIPKEPRITMAGLKRGAEEFEKTCALCHGAQGHGDGSPANSFIDDWGEHIRPANFTLPAGVPGGVKLGHDGRHIYKTIMTGVGGTPMPFFAELYEPETVWDIVHYVQSLRVDAHINELKAAGLTEPIEQVSFCSSAIPWLRSACDTFVMPILELCSVNLDALPKPNLRGQELVEARLKIWASLSEAASREEIDTQLTHLDDSQTEHHIAASQYSPAQEPHL